MDIDDVIIGMDIDSARPLLGAETIPKYRYFILSILDADDVERNKFHTVHSCSCRVISRATGNICGQEISTVLHS